MKGNGDLYKFARLRDFLSRSGYQVEKGQAFKSVHRDHIDLKNLGASDIETDADGEIFVIDPETKQKQQVFMYKKRFYFGDGKTPKFHLFICDAITAWGKGEYAVSSEGTVTIADSSNHCQLMRVSGLELCGYCRNMLINQNKKVPEDSNEMERMLREEAEKAAKDEHLDENVDIRGYVKNWEKISRLYRKKMNYTCEKCGIKLEGRDRRFMQVHHIDGNKLHNGDGNLQCLCIYCHANVNLIHKKRFSEGDNNKLLNEFIKKFKE